jgi:hypothetical protein
MAPLTLPRILTIALAVVVLAVGALLARGSGGVTYRIDSRR